MKFWEAVKTMEEGKKVRKVNWEDEAYIYIDENSEIRDNEGFYPALYCINEKWEIYEDKKEVDPKLKQLFQTLNEDNWFANNQYSEYIYDNNLVDHMTALYVQLMEMRNFYKLD